MEYLRPTRLGVPHALTCIPLRLTRLFGALPPILLVGCSLISQPTDPISSRVAGPEPTPHVSAEEVIQGVKDRLLIMAEPPEKDVEWFLSNRNHWEAKIGFATDTEGSWRVHVRPKNILDKTSVQPVEASWAFAVRTLGEPLISSLAGADKFESMLKRGVPSGPRIAWRYFFPADTCEAKRALDYDCGAVGVYQGEIREREASDQVSEVQGRIFMPESSSVLVLQHGLVSSDPELPPELIRKFGLPSGFRSPNYTIATDGETWTLREELRSVSSFEIYLIPEVNRSQWFIKFEGLPGGSTTRLPDIVVPVVPVGEGREWVLYPNK